ncbi:MAG: DUF5685 family protein [Eubacteriales bacterium]
MFGYIRPHVAELKVRQHNKYKAIYCGLCKSIGKNVSQSTRLALQYDMASFAYLIGELSGDTFQITDQACVAHPLKKRPISADNKTLEYCAHITSLLTYNKLDDMWLDEKKIYAPIGKGMISRGYKKAKNKYSELDKKITQHLNTLHKYEQENEKCIDYPASTTADIMELIGSNAPISDEKIKRPLESLMKNLGIWLYLADAADDAQEDIKKHNYNPLIEGEEISIENIKTAKEVMTYSLVQAAKARDLLPLADAGEFIDNIIYLSLPATMDRIFSKYELNEKE